MGEGAWGIGDSTLGGVGAGIDCFSIMLALSGISKSGLRLKTAPGAGSIGMIGSWALGTSTGEGAKVGAGAEAGKLEADPTGEFLWGTQEQLNCKVLSLQFISGL